GHRLGARFRLDRLDDMEPVGRVFVQDVDGTVAGGAGGERGAGVEGAAVHARADGVGGPDELAGVRVHDDHGGGFAAGDEQTAVGAVHRHGGGLAGGRHRPAGDYPHGGGVDGDDLALVREVVVDHPLAVGDSLFRGAAQGQRLQHLFGSGIDDGDTIGIALEAKDALADRVVQDAIRVFGGGDAAGNLERLQVEHGDFGGIAVADEAAVERGYPGDTVIPLQARHRAQDLERVAVEHVERGALGNEQAARARIKIEVVEVLATAGGGRQGNLVQQVVARGLLPRGQSGEQQAAANRETCRKTPAHRGGHLRSLPRTHVHGGPAKLKAGLRRCDYGTAPILALTQSKACRASARAWRASSMETVSGAAYRSSTAKGDSASRASNSGGTRTPAMRRALSFSCRSWVRGRSAPMWISSALSARSAHCWAWK